LSAIDLKTTRILTATGLLLGLVPSPLSAADVRADMKRADDFGRSAPVRVIRDEVETYWSQDDAVLVYRVDTAPGEHEFLKVDPETGGKLPAFDHEALADALGEAANQKVGKNKLPLAHLEPAADGKSITFFALGKSWRYSPADNQLSPSDQPLPAAGLLPPEEAGRGTRNTGAATALTIENATPGEIEAFWINPAGERKSYGKLPAGQSTTRETYAGHVWLMTDAEGAPLAGVEAPPTPSLARITERVKPKPRPPENLSPDGKWRALILNHNVVIEPVGSGASVTLSTSGTENDGFTRPLIWSPDSTKLVAFREKKIIPRTIHMVESSPPDQVQPRLKTLEYAKPGDEIPQPKPHLFDIEYRREIALDQSLFGNPWEISDLAWAPDSSEFSFVYNQRGHQVLRLVGIRGDSGSVRTIFEDTSDTFIDYSQKFFIHRLPASGEILWTSERTGYNHLYLIDAVSGEVRNPVTRGLRNVREVVEVDEKKREVLLKIRGVSDQDPYHSHFIRVDFDGNRFTRLTTADGDHSIEFSPGRKYYIDTWSRVDQPPVTELRRADDGKLVAELERADDSALLKTGWSRPEPFVAKGRDGVTDIHGIIIRPTGFKPSKKYPVLERIYAGPHDHHVPKSYFPWSEMNAMAELGFIVVAIDGMGTNWRSKMFHDVCWKNLADGGFPDRIPWIKAAAGSRSWMDLSRVGIYGGSAGGQSALAALLHHGDFYQVAVADSGCHDNRMDKIWWNEAWMGWPVDESYERNSNVTHAAKLKGKLLLIAGELDTNVDPASTAQVVAALQKADKDFEFLPVINAGHGAAETPYGKRRRAEFLVRHLGAD
jgi:dipeptidyl aminopeptidase/acylaminoacyl peptidase